MSTTAKPKPSAAGPKDGLPSQIAYLTRALKTPTIGAFWEPLAAQARDENWSHEEYLAALLQRQVADRESKGTVMRIRTAHFPAVKTLEDFNLDHLPSLRRDVLAHLSTGTFVAKAENVILLGPPGLGNGAVRHGQQLDRPAHRRPPRQPARGRAEEDPPLQADHHRPIPTPRLCRGSCGVTAEPFAVAVIWRVG